MRKILLLISDGSEMLEISPFVDIFGWNNILNKNKVELITASIHSEIKATWNTKVIPEINLLETTINPSEFDVLIIPGGFGFAGYFKDLENQVIISIIQQFHKNNKLIVGVCTGALALGMAGILKDKKATTYLYDNKRYFNQLQKYGAISIYQEMVKDGNIITVSAPKNAINIGFELLEDLTSYENMKKVKFNMGF